MFEMETFRQCNNCRWWEMNHRYKKYDTGICQCYDQVKRDYQICCRHRFENEEVYNDSRSNIK